MRTKRKSNLRLCRDFLIVLLIAVCLTGCGKKPVEYGGDIASDTDSTGEYDMDSTKDTMAVEETWEETIEVGADNIGTIEINADVIVPNTDSLKVISAKKRVIDENYKKQVAEGLSDGIIYVYDAETDDYVVAEDYTADTYLLNCNDREYELVFNRDDTCYNSISFLPVNYEQFLEEEERNKYTEVYAYQSNVLYESSDNKCKMTLEDAEFEAEKIFEILDGGELKTVTAYAMEWYCNAENEEDRCRWYDGYSLGVYRSVEDIYVDGCQYSIPRCYWGTDGVEEALWKYRLERLEINLNYDGIVGFIWWYPLELGSVVTDNVQILPYEKAKEALHEAAIEHSLSYGGSKNISYNTLELLYYRCKESDSSDNYSIIPVWRLSNVKDGEITHFVMINAIDGSYVDVKDDIS